MIWITVLISVRSQWLERSAVLSWYIMFTFKNICFSSRINFCFPCVFLFNLMTSPKLFVLSYNIRPSASIKQGHRFTKVLWECANRGFPASTTVKNRWWSFFPVKYRQFCELKKYRYLKLYLFKFNSVTFLACWPRYVCTHRVLHYGLHDVSLSGKKMNLDSKVGYCTEGQWYPDYTMTWKKTGSYLLEHSCRC